MDLAAFIQSLPGFSEKAVRSRILLVAYGLQQEGTIEFSADELKRAFQRARLPSIASLASFLPELCRGNTAPLLTTPEGRYVLSLDGRSEIEIYMDAVAGIRPAKEALLALAARITDAAERRFLNEAFRCLQAGAPRGAIVMTWALTVDHLQNHVLIHHTSAFNNSLKARSDQNKHVIIAIKDDFEKITKEVVFIEVLRSANIITNDVRKILDTQLGFRNTSAHPSTVDVPESKVVGAIEDLVINVILKYKNG
ncbi:MAG: hypothetical protein HZA51_16835 [Planctomycetes bacterium]|nr:hypothetical protein [Planctomycetota bacterium]